MLGSFLLPFAVCYALGWTIEPPWAVPLAGWLFGLSAWSAFGLWLYLRKRRWAFHASLWATAFLAALGWSAQALTFHWLGHSFTRDLFWIGDVFTIADAKGYLVAFGLPALPLALTVFVCTLALWQPWGILGAELQRHRLTKAACLSLSVLALWLLGQASFRPQPRALDFAGTELETIRTITETTLLMLGTSILRIDKQERFFAFEGQPKRMVPAAPSKPPPDFDVLFVIHESFSDWIWPEYMPRTWSEAKERKGTVFTRAYTPSVDSLVSVKSLLTGVSPTAEKSLQRRYPLLWQWAEAAGMHTILGYNGWLESSLDLGRFLLSPPPARTVTREAMPPEVTRGLDLYEGELYLVRELTQAIQEAPARKSLLTVWYSLGMHLPCQDSSPLFTTQPSGGTACERAAGLVDYGMSMILNALRKAGRLDRTLVVITADHGEFREGAMKPGELPKKFDWRDRFTRVPLIVWLPKTWREDRPEIAGMLTRNADRLVSTIDATRMLISLMDGGQVLDLRSVPKRLAFPETADLASEAIAADRWVAGMNRDTFLVNTPDGFMLVSDDLRVVYNEKEGLWVQDDLLKGGGAETDWTRAPASLKEILCPALLARPAFVRMVEESSFGARYGSGLGCPPPLRQLVPQ